MKRWVGEIKLKNGDVASFFYEKEDVLKAYCHAKEEGQKISRDSIIVQVYEVNPWNKEDD